MNATPPIEVEARLRRLERQNRFLLLLLLGFAVIASIAATHRPSHLSADEITTAHLIIVDNHGKVLHETMGLEGEMYVKRSATIQTTNE